ncbi:hypothetical protein Z043_121617 [Scleropages formosus]|uniref:Uncharacterized protein n=1 Tax=Scleropages formosus TaxID=113540 RepID=A0A0P7Y414_SCLFO|nr:hypothetical protein Z043_121617 [Scleropages formosus]
MDVAGQERRILEETVTPLTPRSSCLTSPGCGDPGLAIVRSLADWERKQELLERRTKGKERGAENEDEATDRSSRDPLAEHKRAKEDYIKATEICDFKDLMVPRKKRITSAHVLLRVPTAHGFGAAARYRQSRTAGETLRTRARGRQPTRSTPRVRSHSSYHMGQLEG